jgi:hypothetical protein
VRSGAEAEDHDRTVDAAVHPGPQLRESLERLVQGDGVGGGCDGVVEVAAGDPVRCEPPGDVEVLVLGPPGVATACEDEDEAVRGPVGSQVGWREDGEGSSGHGPSVDRVCIKSHSHVWLCI